MSEHLQRQLKFAMRRLGSGVSIVTAVREKERFAMVATSVSSLSLDPPSILMCVNRNASIYKALQPRAQFCLNILGINHLGLAKHAASASTSEDRFAQGEWSQHVNGVPYLSDAQAAVFCMIDAGLDYGTHFICVGRVAEILLARADRPPLVYYDGRYLEQL